MEAITIRPYFIEDAPAVFEAVDESREALLTWLPASGMVQKEAEVVGWIATHAEAREQGESYHFARARQINYAKKVSSPKKLGLK